MNKYVRSAIDCQVVLDRLDQCEIDGIMKNSNRPVRIDPIHQFSMIYLLLSLAQSKYIIASYF